MRTSQRAVHRSTVSPPPRLWELIWSPGKTNRVVEPLHGVLVAACTVLALLFFAQVAVTAQVYSLGYRAQALAGVISRLDQERAELEEAVTHELRAPVLAMRAVEMGMQKPRVGQLQRVDAKP